MPRRATRELIEEKADDLIYQSGYEATSFADIAEAVGISRGNFYHHFKSKDDILDAVISRRLEATQAMLEDWDTEASPEARIRCFIRILITNQAKIMAFGCPVGTLNTELAKLDHSAKGRATLIFGLFRDWLADQFESLGFAQDAQVLALHLLGRSQGVAVMAATFRDKAYVESEVAALEDWLHGLAKAQGNKH
jgi:TetR/AcrR family transcriptional repressor of nem operon